MITIESVEIVDEEVDVFDVEVETDHSFLVAGVVLHNSATCIAYSDKLWTLEKAPLGHALPFNNGTPRHFSCRSTITVITPSWDELLGKPLTQANNQTLEARFHDELRAMGWDEARIAKAQFNARASMDGQVPATLSFKQFLEKKGAAFQDDILGKGRAELFRKGVLSDLSNLLDFSGNPLTLRELKQRQ
jgi:hypothetical protein